MGLVFINCFIKYIFILLKENLYVETQMLYAHCQFKLYAMKSPQVKVNIKNLKNIQSNEVKLYIVVNLYQPVYNATIVQALLS